MNDYLMPGIPRNIAENPDMETVELIRESITEDSCQVVDSDMLLPCPFCGGEAHIAERFTYGGKLYGACCSGTLCPGSEPFPWCLDYEDAADAWNRRAERTWHDDDERREVARRLRKLAGGYVRVGDIEKALGINMTSPTVDLERDARNINRLADLIEPPLQCPHYHSDTHYCSIHEDIQPIDRDALLALADEMEQAGKEYRYQANENAVYSDLIDDAPEEFIEYARRIREALGVES